MADDLIHKISSVGAEVGRKVTSRMTCVGFKMKEFFHGQSQEEKMVEEATSEALHGPDWSSNLDICDAINTDNVSATEVIRSIRRRIAAENSRVQYLALVLLEACVKNCEEAFSEAAEAEGVVDEVIRLIQDPRTVLDNTRKALSLIEAWGGSANNQEIFKGLKSRGTRFPRLDTKGLAPRYTSLRSMLDSASYAEFRQQTHHEVVVQGFTAERMKETFDVTRDNIELLSIVLPSSQQDALKDNLTATLVHQCRRCQFTIHKIIETTSGSGTNDCVSVLSEALNLSDELQMILMKYEISRLRPPMAQMQPSPMVLPVAVEPGKSHVRLDEDDVMDELDKMIFGKKGWSSADLQDS